MKVRMTHTISGSRNGEPWPQRGTVVDLPDAEAMDYINADMAVPVTVYQQAETAVADDVETEVRSEASPVVDEPRVSQRPVRPSPKDFRGGSSRR